MSVKFDFINGPCKRHALEIGSDFDWTFRRITKSTGLPIDITSFTAQMQIRPAAGDATLIIELSTTNSRITVNGAAGEFVLHVDAADTESLTAGDYVYDFEYTAPGGAKKRLTEGKFSITEQVTE